MTFAGGDCVPRAASAGCAIQAWVHQFSSAELPHGQASLAARIGIGYGEIHRMVVGDPETHQHALVVGAPADDAIRAEAHARPGDVFVSHQASGLLPATFRVEKTEAGARVLDGPPLAPLMNHPPVVASSSAPGALRFLPPTVARKVVDAHAGFAGDFRSTTTVFVCADGVSANDATSHAHVDALYRFLDGEAERQGGVLLQTDFTDKGNVLLVVFGAPTAREYKEVAAMRMACRIQAARARIPLVVSFRIGVASGQVYCGDIGCESRRSWTTLGASVNLAARLMTLCPPGGILSDAPTHERLGRAFQSRSFGFTTLKGWSEPIESFAIEGELHGGERAGFAARGLVGRSAELATVAAALGAAGSGRGGALVVSGEPGMGKSALVAEAGRVAETRGFQVHTGECQAHDVHTPFGPWRRLLGQLLEVDSDGGPTALVSSLQAAIAHRAPDAAGWLPVFAGVFGVTLPETAAMTTLEPRARQARFFEIVLRILEQAALEAPRLIVFEDYQWSDGVSRELLRRVITRVAQLPALVIVTARPSALLDELERTPGITTVPVGELEGEEARALLRAVLPLDPPSPAVEELVLPVCQGNPFFLEAIAASLVSSGFVGRDEDGRWGVRAVLDAVRIPTSIQDVILGQIDRLQEAEKTVLKIGAVVGRVFALDAVGALAPATLERTDIVFAMRAVTDEGLTFVESPEPLNLIFRHVLVRDVAYQTILFRARQDLHVRLARWLEVRHPDTAPIAALLAFHYGEGGDRERALHFSLQAARRAKAQYANDEAAHHYRRVLTLLDGGGPAMVSRNRLRKELAEVLLQAGRYAEALTGFREALDAAAPAPDRAEVHLGLGRAHQELGNTSEAILEFERAMKLLGRRMPQTRFGLAAEGAFHLLVRFVPGLLPKVPDADKSRYARQLHVLLALIRIYFFVDVPKLTWATMIAGTMARRARSPAGSSLAEAFYATLLYSAGFPGATRPTLDRALELAEKSTDAVAEGVVLMRTGTEAAFLNDLERARQLLERSRGVLLGVGEIWELQTNRMMLATTHFLSSDISLAETVYIEMRDNGLAVGARMHDAWCRAWLPFCRYLRGAMDADPARAELELAYQISGEVGDLANQCAALGHLAAVAAREGDPEVAASAAVRAFATIWRYHVLVPFLQIGLLDAADAALYALEHGVRGVPARQLRRIVRLATMKARLLGRRYPYLRGPAARVTARWVCLRSGPGAAESRYAGAIEFLQRGPNRWELGVALLDGARAIPARRVEWHQRARVVLGALGLDAEVWRSEGRPEHPPASRSSTTGPRSSSSA